MISKNKLFIFGLIIGGISQMASADEVGLTRQYSICMDRSGGVTVNMLDCIGAETTRQDARLNRAYKDVMVSLTPERKKQLQEAQRAWIKYRDANCNFYADPNVGTSAALNSNDCFMSSTASRAKELEGFK